MAAPQGMAVGVASTIAQVAGRTEDPGVERIPVSSGPSVEPETETIAQAPVVVLIVAAWNPADVGGAPVPVDMAGGVHQTREPEPSPCRMPVPAAVVVGERAPGIPRHPVETGGSVGPPAPAVRLPVLLDARLPGPSIVDLDPLAMGAQGVAVAAGIDGGVGHETGPMARGPVIQGGSRHARAVLELDPWVVETVGHERLTTANDHRAPLRHDFRESGENRHLGPAASVAVNLVAAVLLHVNPGVGRVHYGQLRFEKVIFDLEAQPPPVQDVEGVLILAVRRPGDPFQGDLGIVVQCQDRTVRHEDGEPRVRRRPDPIAPQNRQVEFEFALGAGTSREQGGVSIQCADETVDAGESTCVFLPRSVRRPDAGRGKDHRKREDADRKRVSHRTVPLRIEAKGSYHLWLRANRVPGRRVRFVRGNPTIRLPVRCKRNTPVTSRGRSGRSGRLPV